MIGPLAFFALLLAAIGCGVADERPHGAPLGGGGGYDEGGGTAQSAIPPCVEGDTRACHVELGVHGLVKSCFHGTQVCEAGVWGACTDGEVTHTMPPANGGSTAPSDDPTAAPGTTPAHGVADAPDEPLPSALALSDAGACANSPCDPTCQQFDEKPLSGGLVSTTSWSGGSVMGISIKNQSLARKGWSQPCSTGADCQFDSFCSNPVSADLANSKVCAHSKCAPGGPLAADCDPCVQKICAEQPACCGGAWDASCVDKVYSTCLAFCDSEPPCAHDKCFTGAPLAADCEGPDPNDAGACVAKVCAQMPSCCTTAWDAACVALIPDLCGEGCPNQGVCKAWTAGMTDTQCSGYDLTMGIPCTNKSGINKLVVCNKGSAVAPPNLTVEAYPSNSGKFVACGGDLDPTKARFTLTTPSPIPPGSCINLDAPANALSGGEQLLVNRGGAGECPGHCLNNWALFSPVGATTVACEPLYCTGGAGGGQRAHRPAIALWVERTSNVGAGAWTKIKTALNNFFVDPIFPASNPNYGWNYLAFAELGFFPSDGATCTTATCGGCSAVTPPGPSAAPWPSGFVPKWRSISASASDLQAVVNATTLSAAKQAPTSAALTAALLEANAWNDAYVNNSYPGESPTVYLILTSEPSTCAGALAMAGAANTALVKSNIRTFVFGIDNGGANRVQLSTISDIAQAGGGRAYMLSASSPTLDTDLKAKLIDARNHLMPCSWELPPEGYFDPFNASNSMTWITLTPAQGPNVAPRVADQAACGNSMGYYYDDPQNPTRVALCPALCDTLNRDVGGGFNLKIACRPSTYGETYQGSCPEGTKTQWGFFEYDTTIPQDTNVVFRGRAANSAAALASQPWTTLAIVPTSPAVEDCLLTGPGPSCPIDLVKKLGGVAPAQADFFELQMDLTPSLSTGTTPSVNSWKLTYSCPPSE